MNYSELTQALQDYLETSETSFVSNIPNFVRQAEERIYRSVAEQYWQRQRMVEAQNAHMMEQIANLSSLTPSPFVVRVMEDAGLDIDKETGA
jgi:hypothetical protein